MEKREDHKFDMEEYKKRQAMFTEVMAIISLKRAKDELDFTYEPDVVKSFLHYLDMESMELMTHYLKMPPAAQEMLYKIREVYEADRERLQGEYEKRGEIHIVYEMHGEVKGFDYQKIPQYCRYGLWVEDVYYAFAAPENINPHYMSAAVANSYIYANFCGLVSHMRTKWNGEHVQIARLEKKNGQTHSLLIARDKVFFLDARYAAQTIEILNKGLVCVAGISDSPQSSAQKEQPRPEDSDGKIVIAVDGEYRVKDARTYDFLVKDGYLVDKTGKSYASAPAQFEGKIVEVGSDYRVIRERPDKKTPLLTDQVNQVANSVTTATLKHHLFDTDARVIFSLEHYVAYTARSQCFVSELLWTIDSVGKCMPQESPYSKEEIFSALAPFAIPIPEKFVVDFEGKGIRREGSVIIISVKKPRALTLAVFLEYARSLEPFSSIRKRLTNDGYVCTTYDWVALREIYYRGYKSYFVTNPGYVTFCPAAHVTQEWLVQGVSDLPYMSVAIHGARTFRCSTAFASIFTCRDPDYAVLTQEDFAPLPKTLYYSDLDNLATHCNKAYDPSTVSILVQKTGRILVGTRPYRWPKINDVLLELEEPKTVSKLAASFGIPTPEMHEFLKQHTDKIYNVGAGKVGRKRK